jgi:hypothetical protein
LKEVTRRLLRRGRKKHIVVNNIGLVYPKKDHNKNIYLFLKTMIMGWLLT